MKVLGMITEYNPFHNGHKYHLRQSLKESGADASVCVMSGSFVQRGEPSIINKWVRAKTAVKSGVDLVIELPVAYSLRSAEYFAWGAVRILDSLGIVDTLSFGSECGSLSSLELIANILSDEPDEYKALLKAELSSGSSFPRARENAVRKFLSSTVADLQSDSSRHSGCDSSDAASCLADSNNILGIEYLKALKKMTSSIKPITVNRIGNEYNSTTLNTELSSASSIRSAIISKGLNPTELADYLPADSVKLMEDEFIHGRGPVGIENFGQFLLSKLRGMSARDLSSYPDVSEGLENRVLEAASKSGTLEELISLSVSKRYTLSRIRRILFSVLIDMKSDLLAEFDANGGPQYIHVLGFNEKGRMLLSDIKKKASLPIMVKPANFKYADNLLLSKMLMLEALATDLYVMAYTNPEQRFGGQEFTCNLF